ncbi:hypothetical protein [Nocardia huaxiensis]|uniref:Sigma-70-like protein n=1 Tax=Nocardia huaxiensis TaxID=2755382 RepID=A0A7D6Z5X2_9NOCA|nr:hypothetical protein [Nocardia huaxiensis]QLY27528.1 hypothetical protein H0264_29250 [Nocardia huaxiensis]UFS97192.1 hypothetical protein LPY97_04480 [Nocardia huaxiensis]
MSDELSERECALRRLPLPYSLALRLRDSGVEPELICEYVGVDAASLESVYRMAELKLAAVCEPGSAANGEAPASDSGGPADPI